MDFKSVYEFGENLDTLTIEIENVNVEALKALEKNGVKVYPSSKTLGIIKNKSRQKNFYQKIISQLQILTHIKVSQN